MKILINQLKNIKNGLQIICGKEKIKINSIKKYGFQLGLTGPNALGEIVQNGIHQIIGEENADGWDEQIEEIWGSQ